MTGILREGNTPGLKLLAWEEVDIPDPCISALQLRFCRTDKLPQYEDNNYFRNEVTVNVLVLENVKLLVHESCLFLDVMKKIREQNADLHHSLLAPGGTAAFAAEGAMSPIGQLMGLGLTSDGRVVSSDGFEEGTTPCFPGREEGYGWVNYAKLADPDSIVLLFQPNGLHFNDGSMFWDGNEIYAYPGLPLARIAEDSEISVEEKGRYGVNEQSMKTPITFIGTTKEGMAALRFEFKEEDTYQTGLGRLKKVLKEREFVNGFAASPALIYPDEMGEPVFNTIEDIITSEAQNDTRHFVYHPQKGKLFLPELARAKRMGRGEEIYKALTSDNRQNRIRLKLQETLEMVNGNLDRLKCILDREGYKNRYEIAEPSESGAIFLEISLQYGVFNHLVTCVTESGKLVVIQTSGIHGNVTGNDGATMREMLGIMRHIQAHLPFDQDPITAAVMSCQGKDVGNVIIEGRDGEIKEIGAEYPALELNDGLEKRGRVTSPKVGVVRN